MQSEKLIKLARLGTAACYVIIIIAFIVRFGWHEGITWALVVGVFGLLALRAGALWGVLAGAEGMSKSILAEIEKSDGKIRIAIESLLDAEATRSGKVIKEAQEVITLYSEMIAGITEQTRKTPKEFLSWLRQNIVEFFDESDLRDLCFDMGIDYANLPGQSKKDKVRELVTYCKNRDRISDLVARLKDARPHVSW